MSGTYKDNWKSALDLKLDYYYGYYCWFFPAAIHFQDLDGLMVDQVIMINECWQERYFGWVLVIIRLLDAMTRGWFQHDLVAYLPLVTQGKLIEDVLPEVRELYDKRMP